GIERHGAAIAPAPDPDPAAIELGKLLQQLFQRRQLIFQLDRPKLALDRGLELAIASRRAAVVYRKDRKPSPREQLMKQAPRPVPVILDCLRCRSSVHIVNDWKFIAAGGSRRKQ